MNRRETERLVAALREARGKGQRVALATVVRVRGSAYRREGTRILVRDDGSYECLLSGGCLEPAVADTAARVISTGRPEIREYDLEADSVWSLGVGCSGAVDILIEPMHDDPVSERWVAALERAEPAVLVKPLSATPGRLLVLEHETFGSLGSDALGLEASRAARTRMRSAFPSSGVDRLGEAELFFDVSMPPPELVIFGAGPDAEPLARFAWELGYTVMVVDVREAFLTRERFPHATLVSSHFSQFAQSVALHERSFVVVMNHQLERDREALRFALASPAPYVGVLGPRSRFHKLIEALREQGEALDPSRLSRARSPVGLALGAESPEEIALSILGEMLGLQRGFDGGFLAGREGSLHRSSDTRALARS